MQVHRVDDDSTIPVSDGTGEYRIGPVTDRAGEVQVHLVEVRAGGSMAGTAPERRLLWVLYGEGRASGGDGPLRRLVAGEAASWEAGEEHAVESEHGLRAVLVEGRFEVLARAILREIVVAEHDPAWLAWFDEVYAHVWPAVADIASRVDHVGSTAVAGLAAKPIVDLDVVVATEDLVRPVMHRLQELDYRWLGELGVAGRQAFSPERGSTAADLPAHHLYCVVDGNRAHLDHVLLRDLLRVDAGARRRYEEVKRAAAASAGEDIDRYTAMKAAVVAELLTRARAERGLDPVAYWQPDTNPGD